MLALSLQLVYGHGECQGTSITNIQHGGEVPRTMRSDGTRPSMAFPKSGEPAGYRVSDVIQRARDPKAIPGFLCLTDLTPAGTELLFLPDGSTITPAPTTLLSAFRATWLQHLAQDEGHEKNA